MSSSNTKPPLRIAHLADIHLGYRRYNRLTKAGFNQREADINGAFREAIDRIVTLSPDLVVLAGDIFHSVRPSNSVLNFCFREIKRLRAKSTAPVVIVAGNHETPRRADTGSPLRILAEIEGVFVSDAAVETFTFPELKTAVTTLPHAAILNGIPPLRANDSYIYNVLVAHGQVEGEWQSEFGGADISRRAISEHEWDYIALGHVHIRQRIGLNGSYSGSIEHTASNIWSESQNPKGFLEIILPELKQNFHTLSTPREVIILPVVNAEGLSPDEVTDAILERIKSVAGGTAGKIIKLEVRNLPREVHRQLRHKDLRLARSEALHFQIDTFAPVDAALADPAVGVRMKALPQALADFCAHQVPELGFSTAKSQELTQVIKVYLDRLEAVHEVS